MEANQPLKKFKAGACTATVWKNEATAKDGSKYPVYNTSLERSYQDDKGEWQTTNSFKQNDLPKAALALKKAYEYLVYEMKLEVQE